MSDTPDVDSAAREERGMPGSFVVEADFARRLRRECTSVEGKLSAANEAIKALNAGLNAEEEQNQRTAESLRKQMKHSLALQHLIESVINGTPFDEDSALAPQQRDALEAFMKRVAASLKAERSAATKEHKTLSDKLAFLDGLHNRAAAVIEEQTARIVELTAETSRASTQIATFRDLNTKLSAAIQLLAGTLAPELREDVLAVVAAWEEAAKEEA